MTMTEQELAAIEARARAATPGPWWPAHRHTGCTPADDERAGLGLDVEGPPEAAGRGQCDAIAVRQRLAG